MQKSIEQWMISEVPVRLMRLVSAAAAIWPDQPTASAASQWIWNWRASRRVPDGEDHLSRSHITAVLQPLSVAVKGPSSGGKSYTVQNAVRFLPQEACFTLTSASERALIYTEEDLHHR